MNIFTVLQLDNGVQLKIGDKVKVKGPNMPLTEARIQGLSANEFIKDYEGEITFYTEKYNMFRLNINEIEKIESLHLKKEDFKPRKRYKIIFTDMVYIGTYRQMQKQFGEAYIENLLKQNRIVEY